MLKNLTILLFSIILFSCKSAANKGESEGAPLQDNAPAEIEVPAFDGDSAYAYVKRQVDFGPRVPNTEAHRKAADWMAAELKRHGVAVTEQPMKLTAFDGTILNARNIFGQINPEAADRTLLVAHYDCRPWADQDPDPEKRKQPVDGANDGASGVGVILEAARQLSLNNPGKGIDFLFVDAEDWGTDDNDESWAMGTRHFVQNPVIAGYLPTRAIILDMVGGKTASFPVEYFSYQNAPEMVSAFWQAAASVGHADLFPRTMGGAVTDDHVEFIKAGVPSIDIIEYHPGQGFTPHWHTSTDNMENISKDTLRDVGESLMKYLYSL